MITDKESQKQDVESLSRNTKSANNPLEQIFDKEKELKRIEAVQLVSEIADKASSVAKNAERIAAQDKAEKKGPLSEEEEKAARDALIEDRKKNPGKYKDKDFEVLVKAKGMDNRANTIMKDGLTNMGGPVQKAISGVAAIAKGIITGNIGGGVAGAASPYLAEAIKEATYDKDDKGNVQVDKNGNPKVNKELNLLLHGLLGAVTSQLGSGNALSGAAGAVSGEVAAEIIYETLYGSKVEESKRVKKEDLNESQKQEIAALASLTGALAGAISSGGDAVAAGEALTTAKNAVENNWGSPAGAGGNLGFWFSKIPDCDEACKAEMALQQAEGNAKVLVIEAGVIGTVVGGYYLIGATPEIIAAARVAISACKGNPVYCLNQVGIHAGEILTEGGIGAGALVVGKSVKDVGKLESIGKDAVRKLVEISDSGKLKSATEADKMVIKVTEKAASEILSLPPGKAGSVVKNELLPHEYEQALDIVKYKGGTFKGSTERSQAGIDGWLDGIPVQLKIVEGQSLNAIRRNIVSGAKDMSKAGYQGDLYIDASKTGVSMKEMIDHFKPGSPVSNITKEGTVKNIYIKTQDGWLNVTGGSITKGANQ